MTKLIRGVPRIERYCRPGELLVWARGLTGLWELRCIQKAVECHLCHHIIERGNLAWRNPTTNRREQYWRVCTGCWPREESA